MVWRRLVSNIVARSGKATRAKVSITSIAPPSLALHSLGWNDPPQNVPIAPPLIPIAMAYELAAAGELLHQVQRRFVLLASESDSSASISKMCKPEEKPDSP
jgi:hypothetical protein